MIWGAHPYFWKHPIGSRIVFHSHQFFRGTTLKLKQFRLPLFEKLMTIPLTGHLCKQPKSFRCSPRGPTSENSKKTTMKTSELRYSPFAYACLCLSTAITAVSAARNELPGGDSMFAESFRWVKWRNGHENGTKNNHQPKLGGGFKYFLFSPLPGEMIQFD